MITDEMINEMNRNDSTICAYCVNREEHDFCYIEKFGICELTCSKCDYVEEI